MNEKMPHGELFLLFCMNSIYTYVPQVKTALMDFCCVKVLKLENGQL